MTQKVIFLDFDGPLSTFRVALATGDMKAFDPIAIGMLNVICEASGAKIVCTSTRAQYDDPTAHANAIRRFSEANLNLSHLHEDWSCRYDNGPRKGHIETWLAAHPDVTHYTIIDDVPVDLPNLVRVSPYDGMNFNDMRKIIRALDLDEDAIFAAIARKNSRNEDPAYQVKRIKLPPYQP